MPEIACEGWRKQLLNCLLQSDCVRKDNFTPRECLEAKLPNVVCPEECMPLRVGLMKCRYSQIDTRTRFRGKSELPKSYD